ncbi:MAG TPA: hypothetical protein VKT70_03040, partial [Stellaceae bacterium]|nr:hypothetical protein [Stellaceae bacterium]
MTTIPSADAVHLITQLLANRATPASEVADLIRSVQATLDLIQTKPDQTKPERSLPSAFAPEATARPAPLAKSPPPKAATRRRVRAEPAIIDAVPTPPPAPKLLRRAEVVGSQASTLPAANPALAPEPRGRRRGIVKWFDIREAKGALRIPGFSGDLPIETPVLAASGITRLFKGQEV